MDQRIIKTRLAIRRAFLKLRETMQLEQIRVLDLCQAAGINKTTFYKYYTDIGDLSAQAERECFDQFWNSFREKDVLFEHPEQFIQGLPEGFDAQGQNIDVLFRNRYDRFFALLEIELLERYLEEPLSREEQIRRSFAIKGLVHMLKELKTNQRWSTGEIARVLAPRIKGI